MERLRNCAEEMVKFAVESRLNDAVRLDWGHRTSDFCSGLLRDDPGDTYPRVAADGAEPFEGVPRYPLYKRLALALLRSIDSGGFCRPYKKIATINEETWLKQKEEEWDKLISEKGSELVNVLKDIVFELHAEEPFFSLIKDGLKTIEGRYLTSDYSRLGPGSLILLNKCLILEVQKVHCYASFYEMLEAESLDKVFPGVNTAEEGKQMLRKLHEEGKERSCGVTAIHVSTTTLQPCIILSNLLSALSYEGVQSLLGLSHTTGTISSTLPPPISTLLASFMSPYKPQVKGCTLTHGARALAKHADRSSDKFWGVLHGSDSNKNRLAMDIMNQLITCCCWMNVHIVPPHGTTFEIRVAEGYGARWSQDGTKFIGFLEPYMDDGHLKGWKH